MRLLGARRAGAARGAGRRRRRRGPRPAPRPTTCAAYLDGDRWYQRLAGRRRRAAPSRRRSPTSRPSSASPRRCRSTPAASASSPATTSRRPPTSASRSSASGCSTARATSRSRCRARAGSRSTTRCSTPTGCRSRCCARPTAPAAQGQRRPARRPHLRRPGLEGAGRPGAAAAARLRRRGQRPSRARGDRPALRRRQRAPAAPGDAARHRRRPRAAGLLPRSPARRRPRCSTPTRATPGSSAWSGSASSPRTHGLDLRRGRSRRPGPATVFTTHTPVPAGIDRFARDLVDAALRRRQRRARRTRRPHPRARRRGLRGRRPGVFNMAVMGLRLAQRANGVSQLHGAGQPRRCSPGCGPASTTPEVPIGHVTNGVHAPTWVAPRGARRWREPRRRRTSLDRRVRPGTASTRCRDAEIWDVARQLRAAAGRRRAPAAARVLAAARRERRPSSAGSTGPRPRRADHRLRPAGAVVQAAHADAARPGAAHARCCSTPSGRSRSSSPARRTRPTTAARS